MHFIKFVSLQSKNIRRHVDALSWFSHDATAAEIAELMVAVGGEAVYMQL